MNSNSQTAGKSNNKYLPWIISIVLVIIVVYLLATRNDNRLTPASSSPVDSPAVNRIPPDSLHH